MRDELQEAPILGKSAQKWVKYIDYYFEARTGYLRLTALVRLNVVFTH